MLILLLELSLGQEPNLANLILGEWSGRVMHPDSRVTLKALTIEFHTQQNSTALEATMWRDDVNTRFSLPIDSFFLAHLEVGWRSDLTATIFNMRPERKFLVDLEFHLSPKDALYTTNRTVGEIELGVWLFNDTYARGYVKHLGTAEFAVYEMKKRKEISRGEPAPSGSWLIVGLATVAIHIALIALLGICRAKRAKPALAEIPSGRAGKWKEE
jgi:hypothetical protein